MSIIIISESSQGLAFLSSSHISDHNRTIPTAPTTAPIAPIHIPVGAAPAVLELVVAAPAPVPVPGGLLVASVDVPALLEVVGVVLTVLVALAASPVIAPTPCDPLGV